MAWTFDEIETGWLAGSRVAVSREEVVVAFERCEQTLGRDWIYERRVQGAGAGPTLAVVRTGQRLASLDGVANVAELLEKLRRGDKSAAAELHALHALRSGRAVTAQMYPHVSIGQTSKVKVPDMRVGSPDGWVYVEVINPNRSEAAERARAILRSVTDLAHRIKQPVTLEIFLRREPTQSEITTIGSHAERFCATRVARGDLPRQGLPPTSAFIFFHSGEPGQSVEFAREELPDGLGLLILQGCPGEIMACQHPGEEHRPRYSMARRICGQNEPDRHLLVRMPFSDDRAAEFVDREARHLPSNAPRLIMIQVSEALGAFKDWEPLIRRRFQPTLNRRVGGVCLFSSGIIPTTDGDACPSRTKLMINPYARLPLPSWITETIEAAGARFEDIVGSEKPNTPRLFEIMEVEEHVGGNAHDVGFALERGPRSV